jgi:hypothetical protein
VKEKQSTSAQQIWEGHWKAFRMKLVERMPRVYKAVIKAKVFFSLFYFLQGQCTLINVSVKVPVLASRLIFNRSPCAFGYFEESKI